MHEFAWRPTAHGATNRILKWRQFYFEQRFSLFAVRVQQLMMSVSCMKMVLESVSLTNTGDYSDDDDTFPMHFFLTVYFFSIICRCQWDFVCRFYSALRGYFFSFELAEIYACICLFKQLRVSNGRTVFCGVLRAISYAIGPTETCFFPRATGMIVACFLIGNSGLISYQCS